MAKTPRVPDTSRKKIQLIIDTQKNAQLAEGSPSLRLRIDRINRVIALLGDNQDAIIEALNADYGNRSNVGSMMTDIYATISSLKSNRNKCAKWMKNSSRAASFPFNLLGGRASIKYQPIGVVGNVVPWNFPFNLAFSPLGSIFAAGNRCIMKPSEYTPHCTHLMKKLVEQYFDVTELAVVTGGPKTGEIFSTMPFDHLLFTGSTSIAPHVIRGSAENIIPLTLELGGKSPVIISQTANMKQTADRIMFAKTLNAGQICLAPDYIMLPENQKETFSDLAIDSVRTMFPTIKDNQDYTSIINERHYDRLKGYLADAKKKGAEIIEINPANENFSQQEHFKIPPTLVINPSDNMKLMQEEIFGPILPIKTYHTINEAIDYVNAHDLPLGLYYFGADKNEENEVTSRTISGGVTINDLLVHATQEGLPFGGVGASGMGAYNGIEGFKNFSHAKPIYRQTPIEKALQMMRPPYTEKFYNLLKSMAN